MSRHTFAVGIDAKVFERPLQLQPAAAHVLGGCAQQAQGGLRIDQRAALLHSSARPPGFAPPGSEPCAFSRDSTNPRSTRRRSRRIFSGWLLAMGLSAYRRCRRKERISPQRPQRVRRTVTNRSSRSTSYGIRIPDLASKSAFLCGLCALCGEAFLRFFPTPYSSFQRQYHRR